MTYKVRPGIVHLRICGVDILAATRALWEQCPAVRPLPRKWAVTWTLLEKGSSETVVNTFCRLLRKPKEEVQEEFEKVFEELYKEGYLIEAEDE